MSEPGPAPKTTRFPRPFGKYQIQREAGRGGRGVVYEAMDTVLQRTVALKMTLSGAGMDAEALAKEQERFLVEARIGAHLPKHPHIVSVYEAGDVQGTPYLASEFIEGEPLAEWRKKRSVGVSTQVRLLRDVALAIEHAHRHGVVHRDLKPGNILIDGEGQPRVTDFGLAKMAGQPVDLACVAPGLIWGTPSYMSPEHALGRDTVGAQADVYSLGAMLYEILSGHPPFHGVNPSEAVKKVVHDPVPPPSALASHPFPPAMKPLELLCMKALSKDPAHRPAGAKAFAQGLSSWLGEGRSTVRLTMSEPKRSKGLLVGGAAGAVVVVAALAFLLLRGSDQPKPAPADTATLAADQIRRREQALRDKQHEAELTVEKARREEAEKARLEQERKLAELQAGRRADEAETLRQQAYLLAQKREAEERARKAEQQLKEAAAPAPVPQPPKPTPQPTVPAPPPTPAPVAPAPAPRNETPSLKTGAPLVLPDGRLHWEAEDYSGGESALAGRDYFDTTPGNNGKVYRGHDVDIAQAGDGTTWVSGIEAGEWLNFKFEGEGRFEVELRYLAGNNAAAHIEVDGASLTGPLRPPPTGGNGPWGTFKAMTSRIPAGAHNLRLIFDSRIFGLDWFRLRKIPLTPPPAAAQLRESEKAIRSLFKADYARKTPADLSGLALKLLQEGIRTEAATADKFALLTEARDVAAQAGDASAALNAIEELDKVFAIDAPALRLDALAACSRAARSPEASRELAECYLTLVDEAVARDEFEVAVGLASKAEAASRNAQDPGLLSRIQARVKELGALRDEFRSVKTALKVLDEKPDDPAANLTVGIYRSFARNDWTRGLPMLAKGSDPVLATLARKDLETAETPAKETSHGDAWREAGEKKMGVTKTRYLNRALYWYEKAISGTAGLDRVRIEGQIESLYRSLGVDNLRKGLVFWIEPGREPDNPFREHASGAKYTNNGGQASEGGRALSFSGSFVDYACPDPVKNVEKTGSIFAWVRNDANNAALLNRGDAERGQVDLWLWIERNLLQVGFAFPENIRKYNSKGQVSQGRWVFCGATWDERNVTLFIDGKEDSTSPIGQNPVFPPRRSSKVRLGALYVGSSEFRGLAGAVMIYNRALTGQEATQLYMAGRSRFR